MNLAALKNHITSLFHNFFSRVVLSGFNPIKSGKDKQGKDKSIFIKTSFYSILEG